MRAGRSKGMALVVAITAFVWPEPAVSLQPCEAWSTFFADEEVSLSYHVEARSDFTGAAGWLLSVNSRTVVRGESPLRVKAGQPATLPITFHTPPVKEGVIVGADLSVSMYDQAAAEPTTFNRPIWIFPRNPWSDRADWLKRLDIALYDPVGKTAEVFERSGIPHREAHNLSSLTAIREGLVVVGEGVSLTQQKALPESLFRLAARGVPVVWLAPADGWFALPGVAGSDHPWPEAVSLRSNVVITKLDKRLDALAWPPDGNVFARRLLVTSRGDRVVAEVTASGEGWPWLEIRYPVPEMTEGDSPIFADHRFATVPGKSGQSPTLIVLCGFAVIERWESGPTPRYLFARLLELASRREP